MADTPRRVSIADVARRAGVSPITVSRVSNGFAGVAEPTRQQVIDAMRELGYRPNGAARALKSGRFRTIGVILFELSVTGSTHTVDAIARHAAAYGYATTLLPVSARTELGVHGAFTRLQELAVDAIVVITEAHLLDASSIGMVPNVPVIVVDSDPGDRFSVVDTDQDDGTRQAVRHLLELGHRTVWHVAGPPDSYSARCRQTTWERTVDAAGREVPAWLPGDWSAESGYRAGLRLAGEPDCTAVFVANDEMALGVLRALHERGRDVPGQLSVVGFDDIDIVANAIPPLTTIRQDFDEVGRRCIEEALAQIHATATESRGGHGSGPARNTILVPPRLVIRRSTAAPPGLADG